MAGVVHSPASVVPVSPECLQAANEIDETMNGNANYKSIKQREAELKANPRNQPMFWADAHPGVPRPPGSDQWGHLLQIEGQQNRLQNALQKYHQNGCTNVAPADVEEAAEYAMADPIGML